jgi:phosphopantetheinyl transferase
MPLVYQHNINETTKLGVWHIAEPEDFFLQRVPVKKDVSHPHKRLQHLAGRYLLPELFNNFPLEEIQVADTRKPFLQNERYHFSISHCGQYAAAIVSSTDRVGIDIEKSTPKIVKVKHKFVSDLEQQFLVPGSKFRFLGSDNSEPGTWNAELLTLLWSCKEAIYKWHGAGQLDFRKHMQLQSAIDGNNAGFMKMTFRFAKQEALLLTLHARFLDDLVLAWTHTS